MALTCTDILTQTPHGLCCPMGGFHIDPVRPVARALITHGHSDHARAGHGAVLATRETLRILAARSGADFAGSSEAAALGEERRIGEVTVRFVPAGHVLGSAKIVIEAGGCRIVVSGDYKREADPTCRPFELVPCDVFITEATFGLPVFRHPPARDEIAKLLESVALFPERAHLVGVYALGKAQRVMALIRAAGHDAPIYLHGALEPLTALYKSEGIDLGDTPKATAAKKSELAGRIVLAPPSATQDLWSRRLPDPVTAFASGWMRARARAPPAAGGGGGRGRGPARRESSCRSSSPTTPIGTTSAAPSPRPAPARSGSRTARRTRSCIGAGREGSRRGRCTCSATAMRRRAARPRRRACLPGRTKPQSTRRATQETAHESHSMDDRGGPRAWRCGRGLGRRARPQGRRLQ